METVNNAVIQSLEAGSGFRARWTNFIKFVIFPEKRKMNFSVLFYLLIYPGP